MQTRLSRTFLESNEGQEAERILRSCVHCGFCTATCPTYQLLGDELDSPRGRIYLIKQMLETETASGRTRQHLDRCLTCRACETTCPSGVEYSHLVDIGRQWVERKTRRPLVERILRQLLCKIIPEPPRYRRMLRLAHLGKIFLPAALRVKIPQIRTSLPVAAQTQARKVLMLNACAQSVTHPQIDTACIRVLNRFDIGVIRETQSGCCGSLEQHLSATDAARMRMQKNIDAWWPHLDNGAEYIIVSASGCAAHMKDYHHFFKDDPVYENKARIISERVRDISEMVAELPIRHHLSDKIDMSVAFHSPCTLQHGQQINQVVEPILKQCGYRVQQPHDAHLCCGSAGTYSILQPQLSIQLLQNKIKQLTAATPDCIATANIGCLMHMQTQSPVPVRHWIELLDEALK